LINAVDNLQPVAVVYKDVDLLSGTNNVSTVGIQLEGEDEIYGLEAVLKKLIETYPGVLRGNVKSSLV
jgi:glutamyl-tRNA synthetase